MSLREDAVDLDVTSLHHRRAVHRWERMSVGDLIERVTWSRPDKVAIVGCPGAYADEQMHTLTYRQADRAANQVAHALLAGGLERGDVVLLFCENSVEAYLAKIGIAKAGLVAAPLNPMMAPTSSGHDRPGPAELAIVDAELWPRARRAVRREGPAGRGHDRHRRCAGAGQRGFTEFISGNAGHRAGRGDPLRRHLGDPVHLGHDGAAEGRHDLARVQLRGRLFGFALSPTRGLRLESDLKVGTYLPMIYHVGDQPFTYSVFLCAGTLVLGRRPNPDHIADD